VRDVLGDESLITQRILYSGSHSGDSIGLDMVPELVREIGSLRALECQELTSFLTALESLTASALAERNPIVFA
jgi:hypothetical protein